MRENGWNVVYIARPIREWSGHDPSMNPSVRNPPDNWGSFSRLSHAFCIEKYKSSILRSGNHSKFHQILRLPRKVTVQLHEILPLPRKSLCRVPLHQVLRLPRKVTVQLHQILPLPRKVKTPKVTTPTLFFYSTILWLCYSLTLLFFDCAIFWLYYSETLLFFYSTILLLYYNFTLLFLDSTMRWLYCSLTLLFFDATILFDCTILWLCYFLTLPSRPYIGSFSTKLPLIIMSLCNYILWCWCRGNLHQDCQGGWGWSRRGLFADVHCGDSYLQGSLQYQFAITRHWVWSVGKSLCLEAQSCYVLDLCSLKGRLTLISHGLRCFWKFKTKDEVDSDSDCGPCTRFLHGPGHNFLQTFWSNETTLENCNTMGRSSKNLRFTRKCRSHGASSAPYTVHGLKKQEDECSPAMASFHNKETWQDLSFES